jgi:site-specific DNA-methyltransferase (adenine-specific)
MWTSLTNKIEYFEYLWNGMIQGISVNSRIQKGDKSLNEKRIHPSQKPTAVYSHLFTTYAKPGFKILDTHVGSQSSRIAAYFAGCDFIGFENDADILQDGNERFKKAIAEPLFDAVEQHKQAVMLFNENEPNGY